MPIHKCIQMTTNLNYTVIILQCTRSKIKYKNKITRKNYKKTYINLNFNKIGLNFVPYFILILL